MVIVRDSDRRQSLAIFAAALPLLLAGCSDRTAVPATPAAAPAPSQAPAVSSDEQVTRANPASENCIAQAGRLSIEKTPKGDQYGVCHFEDNYQCEEWALLRGDCRAGGTRITGYITDAGRYCAITGGTYTVTLEGDAGSERGTCTFTNGQQCDADAYFAGDCSRNPG